MLKRELKQCVLILILDRLFLIIKKIYVKLNIPLTTRADTTPRARLGKKSKKENSSSICQTSKKCFTGNKTFPKEIVQDHFQAS